MKFCQIWSRFPVIYIYIYTSISLTFSPLFGLLLLPSFFSSGVVWLFASPTSFLSLPLSARMPRTAFLSGLMSSTSGWERRRLWWSHSLHREARSAEKGMQHVCTRHLGNSFTHLKKSYFKYVNTQSKASMSLNPCTWWVVLTAVGTSILMPLHQYAEELFKRFAPLHRFCTKCQRSNMHVTLCNLYAFCVVSVCATMHVVSRPHT